MTHTIATTGALTAMPVFGSSFSHTNPSSYRVRHRLLINDTGLQDLALFSTKASIAKLASLKENWDGYGSAAPDPAAIQNALESLERFYALSATTNLPWIAPHVSASEDGSVVLEWWKKTHKLTVYVQRDSAEFIKVWGPSIENEMADGALLGTQFQGLWLWLYA